MNSNLPQDYIELLQELEIELSESISKDSLTTPLSQYIKNYSSILHSITEFKKDTPDYLKVILPLLLTFSQRQGA